MTWENLYEIARSHGDFNPCVPIAFAVLTGKGYSEMNELFIQCGRKPGKRTKDEVTKKVAAVLDINLLEYIGLPINQNKTVKDLRAWLVKSEDKNNWLIKTPGHRFAVKSGVIEDWCFDSNRHIKQVWKVVQR
jgi:hypothetical protein